MTYNVHGFVGADRAYEPERIARVIERANADLVALQEVELGPHRSGEGVMWQWLSNRLGMDGHFTLTRPGSHGGEFGNLVLSRHRFELVSEGTLPRRRGEVRAVQWLKVRAPAGEFHLMNTHLSTAFWERRLQVHALLGAEWIVRAGSDLPLMICGDFNSTPLSPVYRRLRRDLVDAQAASSAKRAPTFPSGFPLFRIDYLFLSREFQVRSCEVTRDALTRVASDHLPLVTELAWEAERSAETPADVARRATTDGGTLAPDSE